MSVWCKLDSCFVMTYFCSYLHFCFPSFLPLHLESSGGWTGTNDSEVLINSWCVEIRHFITASKSHWVKAWRPFLTWGVHRDSLWLSFCLLPPYTKGGSGELLTSLYKMAYFICFTVSATLFFLWFFSAFPEVLILKTAACYWVPGMQQTSISLFMTCKCCDL